MRKPYTNHTQHRRKANVEQHATSSFKKVMGNTKTTRKPYANHKTHTHHRRKKTHTHTHTQQIRKKKNLKMHKNDTQTIRKTNANHTQQVQKHTQQVHKTHIEIIQR